MAVFALLLAVWQGGCSGSGAAGLLQDDGGTSNPQSDSPNRDEAPSEGASFTGSSSGIASGAGSGNASGDTGTGGSGSSGGAGSQSGSSRDATVETGAAYCGACANNQDCQNSCGVAQAGYVWCCGNTICFQWMTACPMPSDGAADSATASDGSNPDAGQNDAVCQRMATTAACQTCCLNHHPTGDQTFNLALVSCACGARGVCGSQCATEYCGGAATAVGDPCDVCLSGSLAVGGACLNPVGNACLADPDCVALLGANGCLAGCP